jgi:hypothetical protein
LTGWAGFSCDFSEACVGNVLASRRVYPGGQDGGRRASALARLFISRPEILFASTSIPPPEENYFGESLEKPAEPFDWDKDAN